METGALQTDGSATQTPQLVEAWQESALAALASVSSHAGTDEDLPTFFGRLSSTVAELTGARRAAFWRLGPDGTLAIQRAAHGFAADSPVYGARLRMGTMGDGVIDNGTSFALDAAWRDAGLPAVTSAIAAPWGAGDLRIGAVAAYDARRCFTARDLWLLRLVGMAAGPISRHRELEDDMARTSVRLEEAMAADYEQAKRRFAIALRDDALQLLTGAELQVERLRRDAGGDRASVRLDQLGDTLHQIEDSLARLLTYLSPNDGAELTGLRGGGRPAARLPGDR